MAEIFKSQNNNFSLNLITILIINEHVHLKCTLPIGDITLLIPLGGHNPSVTSPVRLYKGPGVPFLILPTMNQLSVSRVGALRCERLPRRDALVQTGRTRESGLDRRHLCIQTQTKEGRVLAQEVTGRLLTMQPRNQSLRNDETALQLGFV
jgi:hypothetical protein